MPRREGWRLEPAEAPHHHLPGSQHGLRRPLLRWRRGGGGGEGGLRGLQRRELGSPATASDCAMGLPLFLTPLTIQRDTCGK